MDQLTNYGWAVMQQKQSLPVLPEKTFPARVISEYRGQYKIMTESGPVRAEISGKLRHSARQRSDFPAIGDWILATFCPDRSFAIIEQLLPRYSCFSRKAAGLSTEEQIVAANIDIAFLVMAPGRDFNLRRLERYLTTAWESGANPVIVLSKADTCGDLSEEIAGAASVAFGVPIYAVSALQNRGREELLACLKPGETAVFLGSSGAGKSTLTNWLCGKAVQKVHAVRERDTRGRHTTTSRDLLLLPSGGIIIDTPGMRELQLWTASDGAFSQSFADIDQLAQNCHFSDCSHQSEPGCAVQAALLSGALDLGRWTSYQKLQREQAFLKRKIDKRALSAEKERWKKISKQMRRH
ncbi:ribosome small subunit-dependent GTPase A [Sporolactobacillus spathodeae]|uniref:Small ribosomal subunit biogenesis GTPase RsgA n=1 Tax=Sporolactobacillus spathodeae TaxID=1465502 RepID=A0ABS2QA51_9BACL|nr:ribosome small subunit-dependent GTPase A [Sporolactobacillus spathodeae]MBM7658645.1 ribosome biogenesis GTPase [Sporolactobacillus spathodeae]